MIECLFDDFKWWNVLVQKWCQEHQAANNWIVWYFVIFLQIKAGLLSERSKLKVGDPTEFDSFTSAVIDGKAFQRITSYIEHANSSKNLTVIGGGKYDSRWVAYSKH